MYLEEENMKIKIVGTEALVRGLPIVEYSNNQVAEEIRNLWKKICGKTIEKNL